ncbi:MAG: Glu/Leu/Phe/Val dehydrogenase [Alphaproteobacteria bacterium]|nr:Glu/Leu/Phe/Val dehydrogenase [Alphaproteobacteria bacterium]
MSVFEMPDFDAHEEILFVRDEKAGLKAIIAVHNSNLGPACGGTRMVPYSNSSVALTDALRLSRGMTYKSAMARLPLGGGKAVIIADPATAKTEALLSAYGRAVEGLGGRYITAMDVGMTPADMPVIARTTKYVAGYTQAGKTGGDSGPLTALGVFEGLKAAVRHRLHTDDLKGVRVAVQGLGAVGYDLCRHLAKAGARLVVSDVASARVKLAEEEFDARAVAPTEILGAECDVVSPCALGATLNDASIATLRAKVIAGGANNQLAEDRHGVMLKEKGVLYAPDYVINGGGIIRVAGQIFAWSDSEIEARVLAIGQTLMEIFVRADREGLPPNVIADAIARERVAAGVIPRESCECS